MSLTKYFASQGLTLSDNLKSLVTLWHAHEQSEDFVISLHDTYSLLADQKVHCVRKLESYFEEETNFQKKKLLITKGQGAQQEVTDYLLTCATFKELALLLNNDKSKLTRKYVIAAEKYARETLIAEKTKTEQKLLAQNELLREQTTEHEAHKCLSFLYYLVGKEKLTAEYAYQGRFFDFFYKDSQRLVIIELKVVKLTKCILLNELVRKKDYLAKASKLAYDNPTKKVVIKFVAPAFGDNINAVADGALAQYPGVTINFESWFEHIQPILRKAKADGRNYEQAKSVVGDINNLLSFRE